MPTNSSYNQIILKYIFSEIPLFWRRFVVLEYVLMLEYTFLYLYLLVGYLLVALSILVVLYLYLYVNLCFCTRDIALTPLVCFKLFVLSPYTSLHQRSESQCKSMAKPYCTHDNNDQSLCILLTCCWIAPSFLFMISLYAPHSPSMLST